MTTIEKRLTIENAKLRRIIRLVASDQVRAATLGEQSQYGLAPMQRRAFAQQEGRPS